MPENAVNAPRARQDLRSRLPTRGYRSPLSISPAPPEQHSVSRDASKVSGAPEKADLQNLAGALGKLASIHSAVLTTMLSSVLKTAAVSIANTTAIHQVIDLFGEETKDLREGAIGHLAAGNAVLISGIAAEHGVKISRVTRDADGGLALYFHSGQTGHYAAIFCDNEGELALLRVNRAEDIQEAEEIEKTFVGYLSALRKIGSFLDTNAAAR